jgi:protein TonB
MQYQRPPMRRRAPGVSRYLWQSALIHLGVVAGLTLLWGGREPSRPVPADAPLRVSLLNPAADGETSRAGAALEEAGQASRSDDAQRPMDMTPAVERSKPRVGAPPSSPQTADIPRSLNAPTAVPEVAPPRASPPRGRSNARPRRAAPPALESPQRIEPVRGAPRPPSAPHAEEVAASAGASVPSPSAAQGRHLPLPLLSPEDLEKYAQLPARWRPTTTALHGVDTAISLTTTDVRYVAYFAHLKQKIERQWSYPAEAVARGLQGQLVLLFVLQRSGQVSGVELLRSAGAKVLDQTAWEAVLKASPFDPMPPQIPGEELRIRARFTYVLEDTAPRTRMP